MNYEEMKLIRWAIREAILEERVRLANIIAEVGMKWFGDVQGFSSALEQAIIREESER